MNKRKILLFILISFGISWTTALLLHITKIPYGSLVSRILVAGVYMAGPAIATIIIQKGIYKESLDTYGLTISRVPTSALLIVPAVYLGIIAVSLGVITIGGKVIPEFGEVLLTQEHMLAELSQRAPGKMEEGGVPLPDSSLLLFVMVVLSSVFAGFSLNLPVTLGEELGWRGLLAAETRSLGFWKSNLFIGLVWGIWYIPLVLLGFNFPSYPWPGVAMMLTLTLSVSFLMSYLRYRIKTVLAPAALHGMINGSPVLFAYFVEGGNELWSSMAGVAGIAGVVVITIVILLIDEDFVKNYNKPRPAKVLQKV